MEKIKEKIKNDINYKNILEFLLVILLFLLSIKKGGFYKTDTLFFCLGVSIIYLSYFIFNIFDNKEKYGKYFSNEKFDIISLLLLFLSIFYILPIVFNNYSNLSDSIFEMIRYFNIYMIYNIIKKSNNKGMFLNTIVLITLLQCLIGIDGLGNRYLSELLSNFNSGFLSKDITRLSGTIQYANVLAILCGISLIIVLEKLKNNESTSNSKKYIVWNIAVFIFFSSIILTGSRTAAFLTISIYAVYLLFNKKNLNNIFTLVIIQGIIALIYTALVQNSIVNEPIKVYFYTVIFIVVDLILILMLNYTKKVLNKINIKDRTNFKYKKIIYLCIGVALTIYFIVGINISKPILIDSSSKSNTTSFNLYNINKDSVNNVLIKFILNDPDTRYTFTFIEVTDDFSSNIVKEIKYYDVIKTEINLNYTAKSNSKYLRVVVNCEKGSLNIDEVYENNKEKIINYALFPTDVINRVEDAIYGSTSSRDRIAYSKDSFKIISDSTKNFIVGVGGEGFKNMYELFKSFSYSSTEAHNSFLQIFIESGILGFLSIITIVAFIVYKGKNNYIKFVLLLLICHAVFDLDFSYLLVMCVFAILLACIEFKDTNLSKFENKKNNHVFNLIEVAISTIILIYVIYTLVNANLAYNLKIPVYNSDELTLEKEINVIRLMERRVNLDSGENTYREALNKEYGTYLDILFKTISTIDDKLDSKSILEEEAKNIVVNIKSNADIMLKNSKYDRAIIIKVSDIYFNNLTYFSKVFYQDDKEKGYQQYLSYIMSNMEYIMNNYPNNSNIQKNINSIYNKYYEELKNKNTYLKSSTIENYTDKIKLLISY